jgi:cystathionine beta-lyase
MRYNFDEVIDRRGTNCSKVDGLKNVFGRDDVLPLWVADMEFRTPDFIIEALKRRCEHEVFGYSFAGTAYYDSITGWLEKKHHWKVQTEWVTHVPGIVKGIGFVIQCFTNAGDKVIIQPPVYHPFRLVPQALGREVVFNPLKLTDKGEYAMDWEQLEAVLDERCKLFILCSPHNPGGIVWGKETLAKLAHLCAQRGVLVVSDEIHSEMVYPGHVHLPFPTVSAEAAGNSITFMSPSKTFNIPGIVTSYAVVPDDTIRRRFYHFLNSAGFGEGSVFSYEATTAAYTQGDTWLGEMLAYVRENVRFVTESVEQRLPAIQVYPPQASFLLWLNCKALGLEQKALADLFVNKARLGLNDGSIFGTGGEGYMRMNLGCSRTLLREAMDRLESALVAAR